MTHPAAPARGGEVDKRDGHLAKEQRIAANKVVGACGMEDKACMKKLLGQEDTGRRPRRLLVGIVASVAAEWMSLLPPRIPMVQPLPTLQLYRDPQVHRPTAVQTENRHETVDASCAIGFVGFQSKLCSMFTFSFLDP